ncbi:MAG: tRNA-dihydrouridine synthase family protein [Oscillospiraceae bacterium]|nr:tRNA-dihydrouridine synthase family protein [Oscillospiraceae bacterium]
MDVLFGPMEGITTSSFRRVHAAMFPGCDGYYTPFISPTCDHIFTAREHREIDPERNEGLRVVPQLLGKNTEDFLWAARCLKELGYEEVNLNLGCPSATVTAKGKGAGLLRTPEVLRSFLDGIFAQAPLRVSVKTRLGWARAEEFPALLALYNQYPIAELILHVRTRQEFYTLGAIHREMFDYALRESAAPVTYNGDLLTAADVKAFAEAYPRAERVMLARGAATDPALFRVLRGGAPVSREELRAFHRALSDAYTRDMGALNAMRRMKELWRNMLSLFQGGEALRSRLGRIEDPRKLEDFVSRVLRELPMETEG